MARKRRKERIYIPRERIGKDPSLVGIVFMFIIPPLWPFGVLMCLKWVRNMWRRKKRGDYQNYAALIADRYEISLNEISVKLNKSMAQVLNDVQAMISKGYLGPEAYIDHQRRVLVIEQEEGAADAVETVFVEPERQPEPAKEPEPAKDPERPQPVRETPKEERFEEMLKKIRTLNDEIADETVSRDIDRIGELTASIFGIVRARPERMDEVRKFMDYYLPTTFGLLESYALMEKQTYQSANIIESRRKIEKTMGELVEAFKRQHDRMFKQDAMDVDTEIEVLKKVMASDGLTEAEGVDIHREFERRRQEGA